jgi:uncharacterized protein (TIGR03000 family)
MNSRLSIATLLSLGCVLFIAETADAQFRSRSARRNWNTYVAPFTGVYADGQGRLYDSQAYDNRFYDGRYYDGRYYDGRYYDGRYYSQPYMGTRYYETYPRTSFYYTPNYSMPSSEYLQANNNFGNIRVIVPDPQAKIWFDGHLTQQSGTDRLFSTPQLQVGTSAAYTIKCTWMQAGREMSQERVVSVSAGRTAMVDFTQASSQPVPAPQPPKASSTPVTPAPEPQILEGRIIRTGKDDFVIETRDQKQVTVYTNPQTRFVIDDRTGAFTDLRSGNTVRMGFTLQGDRHIANTVNITVPR